MSSTVVIKSNKSGMSVFLDPNIPLEQLLEDVARKFRESAKFWGSVQMTLTLEGRDLTPEEEFQIVNVITEHSQIEILCLLDKDANRIKECEKALNEKLMELSSTTGQFFRGNLREGESLESESSIVIIGDVGKGAKVTAKGNVIVLGRRGRQRGCRDCGLRDGAHPAADRGLRRQVPAEKQETWQGTYDGLCRK